MGLRGISLERASWGELEALSEVVVAVGNVLSRVREPSGLGVILRSL